MAPSDWELGKPSLPRNDGKPGIGQAVVRVVTSNGAGSGVCVWASNGEGLILSARHLYDERMRQVRVANVAANVSFPDGRSFRVTETFECQGADLCGMTFSYTGKDPYCVPVTNSSPGRGSKVWKVGYPALANRTAPQDCRTGEVLGSEQMGLAFSNWIRPGDSGGGLFNKDGYLIGVLIIAVGDRVRTDRGVQFQYSRGIAVPTGTVYDFTYKVCFPRLRRGTPPSRDKGMLPPPPAQDNSPPPGIPNSPTPNPTPPAPTVPDYGPILKDILDANRKMLDRIERLEARGSQPGATGPIGPKGEQGAKGEPGSKGDKGEPGVNGTSINQAELDSLRAELNRLKNQKFKVELIGPDGKILKTDEFGPSKPLKLQLKPIQ